MTREEALGFSCHGEQLWGILHRPAQPRSRAVLVVVGGPQTRVGSHRQFVLLARALAEQGYACLRFDYRGMGDSSGDMRDFEAVDDDIRCALDALSTAVPQADELVIWGLCDAASAALFIAPDEPRLTGLVLLNPWVRSEQGLARSYLKRYYLQRLFSRELWLKIARGQFDFAGSLTSLLAMVKSAVGRSAASSQTCKPAESGADASPLAAANAAMVSPPEPGQSEPAQPQRSALAERMAAGLASFNGASLFILSGRDLTAGEFKDAVKESRQWRKLLKRNNATVHHYPAADHTFSTREWRDQVAQWTLKWLDSY